VTVSASGDLAGKFLTAIAPNSSHTCALDSGHQVYCWGTNTYGTNGLGQPDGATNSSSAQLTPKHLASLSAVTVNSISSGGTESCATSSGGALYCWGGQPVGDGYESNDALSPVQINGGLLSSKTVSKVSSGDYSTCAVDSDGSLYCWGVDDNNQIGDNGTDSSYYPNEIAVSPSAPSTPTVPGAPRGVSDFSSPGSITLNWTAPFNSGGAAITSYEAFASDGTNTFNCTGVGSGATTCTINALVNGTSYNLSLVAKNSVGSSSVVHAGSQTPMTVPNPPVSVSALGANQALKVSWNPAAFNGGSAITSFTASATILAVTKTCTASGATATTCTINGLVNGTNYSVTVKATNAIGTSTSSSSVSATPAAVPSAPTQIKAAPSTGSVVVSWNAPASDGGFAVTSYTVSASPGGASCNVAATVFQCTFSSLVSTTGYVFNVTAHNSVGASAPGSTVMTFPLVTSSLTMSVASTVLSKGANFAIILTGSNVNTKATVTLGPKVVSCIFNAGRQCSVSMSLSTNGAFRAVAKVGGTPATLQLYVPLVNAPANAFHKKSFKVTVTYCPPGKLIQLSFSNGQKVLFHSTFKGVGFGVVTIVKTGTVTMTTNVSGTVIAPTWKIKII
jgi:hypothetical protein